MFLKNTFKMILNFLRICLEFVLSVHGVLQKVARRKPNLQFLTRHPLGEIALGICTITISIWFCSFMGVILFFLTVYRFFVDAYLRFTHGEDYVGLIEATDAVWAIEDQSRGIVNGLMVIEADLEPNEFFVRMKERVCNSLLKSKKFRYVRGRSGGYLYYLRNKVSDDVMVRKLEVIENGRELEKDELMILLSKYCNTPLPYNDTGTNEILIGLQSVKWRSPKNCKYQYPVLYKLHHCIGDGISMQQLVMKKLADGNVTTIMSQILKKEEKKQAKPKKSLLDCFGSAQKKIKKCTAMLMKIVRLSAHRLAYLEEQERNIIHGAELSGEKHLVCCVEDEPEHLSMIKEIKKNVGESGFSEICVTALAASFSEYFHEKCPISEIPDHISAAVTVIPPNEKLDINDPKIPTHNRFSLTLVGLPLEKKDNILELLKLAKIEFTAIKNAVDVVWNYWQMRYAFGLLPISTVRTLMAKADSTIGFSILPGTDLVTVCNGCKVLDFIFWIPNKAIVGIGVSVYTYDNRIQLGLLADKSVIAEFIDAKKILQKIFANIKKMYLESKNNK